eukprot:jgi/Hompol1/6777/HPOL_000933-RA
MARTLTRTLEQSRAFSVSPSASASNPQLSFPCVDRLDERQKALEGGPEPLYAKIVTGYEVFESSQPLLLQHGGNLQQFQIAYETWGTLNAAKDNAVLLHTGLSGSSHAKSHAKNPAPGWWEKFIGPNESIDTDKFFVICTNVVGGCYGSTGPSSIDPSDGKPYATRFPIITVFDMVRAQFRLLDSLGINKLHASVGSSMGGMQSLAAAALFPDRVGKIVSTSAAARSHPFSISMRYAQRQVLMTDPNWNRGFYYSGVFPHVGMKLARQIATITYRSGPEWEQRFGRMRADPSLPPSFCPDYLIETYLDHQSERFCLTYDPNSLLYISKAMDMFDMSELASEQVRAETSIVPEGEPDEVRQARLKRALVDGMRKIQMPALVLGVQSDILFPVWQQQEISQSLKAAGNKNVTYYELDALYGHDTFLIDQVNVGSAIKGHLEIA